MKKIISVLMIVVMTFACSVPVAAATTEIGKPTVTVSAKTNSSVSLKWDAVKGAEKYVVYYSTKKDGEYTKYGSVTKTAVTVKKLKASTKYYFKVRASATVNKKAVYGKYSAIVSATTSAAEKSSTSTTLKIVKKPDKVKINETASVTIQGKPNTEYTLMVRYKTKWSDANGLGKATTDKDGKYTWTWKIGGNTSNGTHGIRVTGNDESVEETFETYGR